MTDETCSVCGGKVIDPGMDYSNSCSACGKSCCGRCLHRFWHPDPDNFRSLPRSISLCPGCLTLGHEHFERYCRAADRHYVSADEMLSAYSSLCGWAFTILSTGGEGRPR